MNKFTVLVRDANNNKVGELDGYTAFEAVPRYNAVGNWTMEMDFDLVQSMLINRYAGIAVVLDGSVVFSGPISGIRRVDEDLKNTVLVTGTDDMGYLGGRLLLPVPSGPPYSGSEYDVRTGTAEAVIKEYINYNCGPLAKASRMIPGLTIASNSNRGNQVTGRARFDKLMDFIPILAAKGGVGFECVDLTFDCYIPVDLSSSIVLSKTLGTLSNFVYEISLPEANYLFVGGSGNGTSRTFAEIGDSQSILDWRLKEDFLNYNKTNVVAELLDAGESELVQRAGAIKVEVKSQSMPGREPIMNYRLGDTVKVILDGIPFLVKATEFKISLAGNGSQKVRPVFSSSEVPVGLLHNFDRNARLRQTVNRLERN